MSEKISRLGASDTAKLQPSLFCVQTFRPMLYEIYRLIHEIAQIATRHLIHHQTPARLGFVGSFRRPRLIEKSVTE